ncbi:dihydroceramide delta(4)-desaturase [Chaetomidium leptoderma]|uniref:sphingolipid 4-desaturase n=1 Tax=Chaetomidium leptoderma TaxID=669021 RepID=A0AAN6VVK9_9PEZI|nr:dihydroceramide delta(4)-desaturase [Chaetomidium leptoderma]
MSKPENLPEMEYRFLGRSGLQVSAISLGGWLTYGGHVDREGTYACMKAAYDCGVNFFDCAEGYADGESEKVMGEAIKKYGWKRNDVVISTKLYWGDSFSDSKINNRGLSRKHVIEGMNMSLERMQLEYVDLIYAHRPDRHTPMEETVRAFNHLIHTGKALYWGTSEWNADEIAQAWRYADKLGLIGPVMEQPRYNMLERIQVEGEYSHLYREVGLGLTVFSPMRQGILSGKYKNGIPDDSRFAQTQVEFIAGFWERTGKEQFQAMADLVSKLEPIAERLGIKQSVLALAWVLANPNVSSAITGASSPAQVYENIEAVRAYKKLTPEILKEIDEILNNKPPTVTMSYAPAAEAELEDPKYRDFFWTYTEEPHRTRRLAIIKAHPEVTKLCGPEPLTKFVVAGVVALQLLLAHLLRNTSFWSWKFWAVGYVFGATSNQNLFLAIHEISHNLAFRSPMANRLFAIFANLPIAVPYSASFRPYHLTHHKSLGVDGLDTDLPTAFEAIFLDSILGKAFFCTFQIFFYAIRPMTVYRVPFTWVHGLNVAVQLGFDYALVCLLPGYFTFRSLLYLLLSSFLAGSLHPTAGHFIAEHYVYEKILPDAREPSNNIPVPETFSYYGPLNLVTYNVGLHNEHHDFPAIPWTRLPLLHKMAAEFYADLPQHRSWTYVLWRFIFDEEVGMRCRVKRKQGGRVVGGGSVVAKVADWKESEIEA